MRTREGRRLCHKTELSSLHVPPTLVTRTKKTEEKKKSKE